MIKVSVILPVYGVAEYIEKCAQSLLDQTLQEMEFLFVDDHGPDNSIELLQNLIKDHPRKDQFRVLRPEHNVGAGMARNFAIPQAQGEYVAFVDSDDWVEPTMFEKLYDEAVRQGGVDLCYCQELKDYTDGRPSEVVSNPAVEPGEFTREKRQFFLKNYVSLFTTFIYRRDLLMKNDIRYAESRSADDSYFVTSSLLMAQSTAHIDVPLYHYLIRPGSVCTTKDSNKYLKRLATFRSLMEYFKSHGVYAEYKQEIDFIYIKKGYLSSVTNYIINSLEPNHEVYEEIYAELLQQVPDYKANTYLGFKYKALIWFLRHCPSLGTKAIRIFVKKSGFVG